MALATTPLPAAAQPAPRPTIRDILRERIEVGRQSVGMIAVTLEGGRRELVTYGRSGTADDGVPERDIILDETKRILRDLVLLSSPKPAAAPTIAAQRR